MHHKKRAICVGIRCKMQSTASQVYREMHCKGVQHQQQLQAPGRAYGAVLTAHSATYTGALCTIPVILQNTICTRGMVRHAS